MVFLFMNILIDNLFLQIFYIQSRKICLSKKDFLPILFFTRLGTASTLKTFHISVHSTKKRK